VRLRRIPLVAAGVLAAAAAPAPAATVSADEAVSFRAAPGERNRLQVSEEPGRIVLVDPGARFTARRPCRREGAHRASCPGGGEDTIDVHLGDRADRAGMSLQYLGWTVHGGRGDDVLTGNFGSDTLYGDRGRDILRGGPGSDSLHAGSGRDRVYGGPGSDTLYDDRSKLPTSGDVFVGGPNDSTWNGGPGDVVSYAGRRVPLDLDLTRTPVNRSGEGDRFRGIESLRGGRGNDRIAGTSATNWLEGGPGHDRVFGRGGHDVLIGDPSGFKGNDMLSGGGSRDVLWGEAGRDRLIGGGGGDLLVGLDTPSNAERPDADVAPDAAECGNGEDFVRGGPLDTLRECEHAQGWTASLDVRVRPRIQSRSAIFDVTCRGFNGCQGEARLYSPKGADYGRVDFNLEQDQPNAQISVPLTRAGRSAFDFGVTFVAEFEATDTTHIFGSPVLGYRTFMGAR
jgi:hypothetical protein